IFTLFSFLVITLLGSMIFLQYYKGSRTAMDMTRKLIDENIAQVVSKIEKLYEPMIFVVEQSSSFPGFTEKFTLQSHPAEDLFLRTMKRYDQIQNMYIGYEDGDFYEILSFNGPSREELLKTVGAPQDSEFAILRQFSVEGRTSPVRLWKFLNSTGHTIGSHQDWETDFDPRLRPWYINSKGEEAPVKTGPYLFKIFNQPGLTVSRTLEGRMNGVLGVDMLVSELSDFLEQLGREEHALILLLNDKGECIACPGEALFTEESTTLPHMSDAEHPAIRAYLSQPVESPGPMDRELTVTTEDKEEFVIRIHPMPNSPEEYIFIALSKSEIMAPIVSIIRITALLSLTVLLLSIPLIYVFSSLISRPIDNLVKEARKIGEFKLEEDIVPNGFIYETFRLSEEMASMKKGLRLFSSYVPPDLVKQVLSSQIDTNIGGECRDMTFLFSDIENFTGLSEGRDVESLFEQLSHYFAGLTSVIRGEKGTVDKYIGDSIMAFWNGLKETENHADLSCRAALAMEKLAEELNGKWMGRGYPPFKTRIGIESGQAMVGNVGSSQRMNFTVIGETVNRCSRLEGLNKFYRTRIIIGEGTKERLREAFLLRALDSVIVKGCTKPMKIYELRAAPGEVAPVEREFLDLSLRGLESFLEQDIDAALECYRSALTLNERDYNTRRMVAQCRAILEKTQSWSPHRKMGVK
ncbi:MAG: adenylate/guanylate cyclase domain-containing protein, partial [Spirochaetales bacterium]|nr:adenylate/guanylate cyclase domain-containing protein [Spirochaetales bacterium]